MKKISILYAVFSWNCKKFQKVYFSSNIICFPSAQKKCCSHQFQSFAYFGKEKNSRCVHIHTYMGMGCSTFLPCHRSLTQRFSFFVQCSWALLWFGRNFYAFPLVTSYQSMATEKHKSKYFARWCVHVRVDVFFPLRNEVALSNGFLTIVEIPKGETLPSKPKTNHLD